MIMLKRLSLLLLFLLAPPVLALTLEGHSEQGGLLLGRIEPGTRVELDGERVRVSPEGVFLLGFHRDHPAQSRLLLTYPDGRLEQRRIEVALREYEIQRIDGLPAEKVNPPPEVQERIRQEAQLSADARKRDDPRADFLSGWRWPVEGRISGVYGSQRILNGEPKQPHYGVDIAAPAGTPVVAPADGLVTLAHPDMYYSGGTLILDHGHHLSSSFLHLSEILVTEGQSVKRGEVIAKVGATGRVTGAHLDWRMSLGKARIDPQRLVAPMPVLSSSP
jgi:murein DD-endopeptidase MepM/ murein hydrolase activator NlpD